MKTIRNPCSDWKRKLLKSSLLLLLVACSPVEESLFCEVASREGHGDTLTNVPTGYYGVTEAAVMAVGEEYKEVDATIAKAYLKLLQSKWEGKEGFSESPLFVRRALVDASYNIGPSVLGYPKLTKSLAIGDSIGVVRELLDTASVDGRAVRGLAVRRAELYNRVADRDITGVEQGEDGTLTYWSGDLIILKYRPKGGRHEKSSVGYITVVP